MKKALPEEVRKYFQAIGRKQGNALKEKHGSAYFKRIARMRRRHGRQKLPSEPAKNATSE